ncbi:hypothetical protein BLY90_000157 [Salmonella enterica subsp. enterica serovar Lattenkamp]|uniref:Uncharacterized protein n=2 Tax=Salmonella enterica TaxID=28901 RepID=A0A749S7C8_SALER|nr:hypothetical protein [Salmonella enterica subsp. enterica]EDU0232156.1 hypothetical protein [Salmonella enterica subsp. enterica serovar Lattenkamp]HAF1591528.1 hypothetical protein [Salmonella enterica]EDV3562042.1 hypothetical protein [Salmonella enterica subsp. enterica]EEJ1813074.1 hypothetical protein [Salmonella enterica subsp. enterica]
MKHLRLLLYYAKKRVTMHPWFNTNSPAGWRRERALSGLQNNTQAR